MPAIKELNPKLALPDTAIAPVHRSDGSGTTFLFTNYLSKSSPKFKDKIGAQHGRAVAGRHRRQGQRRRRQHDQQTDGAIGYVEYAYAKQNKMAYAQLINKDGKRRSERRGVPGRRRECRLGATPTGYYLILTDQAGAKSWPITGASFILMYAQPPDPAAGAEALKFFDWAYKNGAADGRRARLRAAAAALVEQVQKTWTSADQGAAASRSGADNLV